MLYSENGTNKTVQRKIFNKIKYWLKFIIWLFQAGHIKKSVCFYRQRYLLNIKNKGGKCEVVAAPFAVFLNKDDINYVEPDISVICDPSKLDEKGCHGAPDWIIEIVSPGNKSMDY